jgi:hypothetical protein
VAEVQFVAPEVLVAAAQTNGADPVELVGVGRPARGEDGHLVAPADERGAE